MPHRLAARLIGLIVCVGAMWTSACAGPPQSQPAATALDRHVVIISVDGLRPDMALRVEMPTLRGLMKRGCFTFWAQTVPVAITLPSHTSMLTGVGVATHGVDWNGDTPAGVYPYSRVPTLFEVARKAGFTTAMAAGKSKFVAVAKPGTLNWSFIPDAAKTTNNAVADQAVAMIHAHTPGVLFVHFPDVDTAGHAFGWGSPEQVKAIENADGQIHRVLEAVEQEHLTDKTLVIVTADHGGAGLNHGPGDPRSRHIPWIAAGPDVRENFDLTLLDKLTVHTEDTFATACWFLSIPLPAGVEGNPVKEISQPRPAGEAKRVEPAVKN